MALIGQNLTIDNNSCVLVSHTVHEANTLPFECIQRFLSFPEVGPLIFCRFKAFIAWSQPAYDIIRCFAWGTNICVPDFPDPFCVAVRNIRVSLLLLDQLG